jgi:hypothetical protein
MSKQSYSVQDAQQLIEELKYKRDVCTRRGVELADERAALAFAAHADGDVRARKRLQEIHDAIARHASELTSIDEALRVAGERQEAARRAEAAAADYAKAREVLTLADSFDSEVHSLARAADVLVQSTNSIIRLHTKMSALDAQRPTRMQLDAVISRVICTMVQAANQQAHCGTHFLAPDERREATALLQYSATIRADANARLSDETEKEAA